MAFVFQGIYNKLKSSCILTSPLTQFNQVTLGMWPYNPTQILKSACSAEQNPVLTPPSLVNIFKKYRVFKISKVIPNFDPSSIPKPFTPPGINHFLPF